MWASYKGHYEVVKLLLIVLKMDEKSKDNCSETTISFDPTKDCREKFEFCRFKSDLYKKIIFHE